MSIFITFSRNNYISEYENVDILRNTFVDKLLKLLILIFYRIPLSNFFETHIDFFRNFRELAC